MSEVVQVLPHVVQELPQWVKPCASPVGEALRPRNGPLSLGVTQQVQLQQQPKQPHTQQQPPQPQTLQLQQQQHHHQPCSQGEKVPPQPQRPQKPEPTS